MCNLILALLVTLGLGLGTVGCGEKAPDKKVIKPVPTAPTTPPAKAD
jgi:hypothetical protein